MKKMFLGFTLILSGHFALASSTPINTNVRLKNEKFSELIFKALEKKALAVESGSVKTVSIQGLITCKRTVGIVKTDYRCDLLKGAWVYLGSESYSSGDKQDLTKKLYDGLTLKVTREAGMNFKTIELNVKDPNGGTERNLLSCTRMGKEAEEMGLRDTCQLMNAL